MELHHTLTQLREMRMSGFIAGLQEQIKNEIYRELSFEERFAWVVDREYLARKQKRVNALLRRAALKYSQARIETIDFEFPRGLKKADFLELARGTWLAEHQQLLIVGPTGVGKTFLACALAQRALELGYSTRYEKLGTLLGELALRQADGSYRSKLKALRNVELLILDEWLLSPLTAQQARDLLDLIDERYLHRSTILISQLPVETWHTQIQDATVADALLDRIVHQARRITLLGDSMRKLTSRLPAA